MHSVSVASWVGSVWSFREGRVLLGRVKAVEGDRATLAVVGLGPVAPDGVEILPLDAGGGQLVRVSLRLLQDRWKRMGCPG
jgi:hypothetical protein